MTFRALRIIETPSGGYERRIESLSLDDLPAGEILIRVHYAGLNYKDALSATGNKGITKSYPHTPGIDAAGVVELSTSESFAVNDEVLVTGFDMGMNTDGSFAQYIRVPSKWVIRKPAAYSPFQCMVIGTAGLTAAAAVRKMLQMGQLPDQGPVVVSGSTGGVGSLAVALLSTSGFEVIATTGKAEAEQYLTHLGATSVQQRSFLDDRSGKPLLRSAWAGGVDTVGGNTLATMIKGCKSEGSVVSTGLVDSHQLSTTVFPFILNGVNLLGIASADSPIEMKKIFWDQLGLATGLKEKLSVIGKEVNLEELNEKYIGAMLEGKIMGRIVINLRD